MFAVSLFLTFYLQRSLGFSPVLTGVAFLPMVASIVTASTTVPSTLLPRFGPSPLVAAGLTLGAVAMACSRASTSTAPTSAASCPR